MSTRVDNVINKIYKMTIENKLINDEVNFLIWQIMKIWARGKQKLLEEFGLTGSQMEILSAVYHLSQTEAEVTQITISNVTNIDPMTTSTILRNLQKKKLITRKASKTDTRARVVEITKEGESLLNQASQKINNSTEAIFTKIDRETLKTQLRTLLDVLTELSNLN